MKTTFISAALVAPLLIGQAHAAPFEPFAALSNGKDCRIVLDFPDGNFCGETVPVNAVRSWYMGEGSTVGNSEQMLLGQKYHFTLVVNGAEGPKVLPVLFLNPGTAKRFYVQVGAWTGLQSASGSEMPFPNWLNLAR